MKLTVRIDGPYSLQSDFIELDGGAVLVGRAAGAKLKLRDPHLSNEHVLLYPDTAGGLRARDLRSTNGTFLGGKQIVDAAVRVGDTLELGSTLLTVVGFTPEAQESAPSLDGLYDMEDPAPAARRS